MDSSSIVSSLGVGSGLDLSSLLSKLMSAEQQPLVLNQQQQSTDQTKISAYGSISSKLSALQGAADSLNSSLNLEAYTAASSDNTVASATTTVGAATGTYGIHVANLATAHTLNSKAFAAASTVIGTGTMRIGVGGSTFDVTIDNTNDTLAGIRDAINTASNNTGVNATIITDVNGSRLALTSRNTGSTNAISVAVSETGSNGFTSAGGDPLNLDNTSGLSQLAYVTGAATNLTEAQQALDASLTINGIQVNSASNTVSSAISGVTVNLTKSGDTTITVGRDTAAITKLVTAFAKAFSDVQATTRSFTAYDASNKTANTLTGDAAARGVISTLNRTLWTTPSSVTGTYKTLSDLGISLAKDGTLSVDSTKLQTAITTDFASVKSVLMGYGSAMSTTVDSMTGTSGIITSRVNGLNSSIKLLGQQADAINLRLAAVEQRYRTQFTALDSMVSQMNATSTYLTQQLAKL